MSRFDLKIWLKNWLWYLFLGSMSFNREWFDFMDKGSSGGGGIGGNTITVTGQDGSVTEIQSIGDASSHVVSTAPGTTVSVSSRGKGSFTAKGVFTFVLIGLTLYMSMYVFMEMFDPTLYRKLEPKTSHQVFMIIILLAYAINIVSVFYDFIKEHREKGAGKKFLWIFFGSFAVITIPCVLYFLTFLAKYKLNFYIPIKYFMDFSLF